MVGTDDPYNKDRADAIITIERDRINDALTYAYQDLNIGYNFYGGNKPYVDANDLLNESCNIYIPMGDSDPTSNFLGLDYGNTEYKGGKNAASQYIGNLAANTGFIEGMLAPNMYVIPGSDLDLTSTDQIADGFADGQLIRIHNGHASNTLIIDNGNNVSTSDGRSCKLGLNEIISFRWSARKSLWIETSRSSTIHDEKVSYTACTYNATTNITIGDTDDVSFRLSYIAERDIGTVQKQAGTIDVLYDDVSGVVSYSSDFIPATDLGFTIEADQNAGNIRLNIIVDNAYAENVSFDQTLISKFYE